MTSGKIERLVALLAAASVFAGLAAFAVVCWSRGVLEPVPASFMLLDRHGTFLAQIGGGDVAKIF